MKKIYLSLFAGLLMASGAFAQAVVYDLEGAKITVDGKADEAAWKSATMYKVDKIFGDNAASFTDAADFAGYWKACYNADGIYVLVAVTADDKLFVDGTAGGIGAPYEQDLVEVYFNMNGGGDTTKTGPSTGLNTSQPNNGKFQFAYQRTIAATNPAWATGVTRKIVLDGNKSVEEIYVPWALITNAKGDVYTPGDGKASFGFDVYLADNDGVVPARSRMVWMYDGKDANEAWTSMKGCGSVVTSIKVGTATLDGAKLVYNNPVKNSLVIDGAKKVTSYAIIDAAGRKITSGSNNSNKLTVNTSSLRKGVYVATVATASGARKSFSFVKN